MVRKEEIESAEHHRDDLSGRADRLYDELTRAKLTLDGRKAVLSEKQKARAKAAAQKAELLERKQQHEAELSRCQQDTKLVQRELTDVDDVLAVEQDAFDMVRQVQTGMIESRAALREVRQELEALSSERAKEAALQAAGGELPDEVAPRPAVGTVRSTTPSKLPPELSTQQLDSPEENTLLQQGRESLAVLTALLRSLKVHSTEMREGLKQWGFARHMNLEHEQYIAKLSEQEQDSLKAIAELQAEERSLTGERQAQASGKDSANGGKVALQERHAAASGGLGQLDDVCMKLQESQREKKVVLEEARRQHERLSMQFKELELDLAAKQSELERFPNDAAKRSAVAAKLAGNMAAQAQKAAHELEVVRQEYASLRHAEAQLKQAHATVVIELEDAKNAHQDLRDRHDLLNRDLLALAHHYTEALAELVPSGTLGMDRPVALSGSYEVVSTSPAGSPPQRSLQGGRGGEEVAGGGRTPRGGTPRAGTPRGGLAENGQTYRSRSGGTPRGATPRGKATHNLTPEGRLVASTGP